MSKDRLGRGLGALMGEQFDNETPNTQPTNNVSVTSLRANPNQPRREFAESELEELADSIEQNGLLQPLLVRPRTAGTYEIIAGERRFRAIQSLGWSEVPVVVRDVDDQELLILAMVENLQREELSPLEEAEGYRVLTEEHGLSQGDVAKVVGKSRPTIANALRLLGLPPSVRRLVESGELSAAHGRTLLRIQDPVRAAEVARQIVKEGWSVREAEREIASDRPRPKASTPKPRDPRVEALERALEEALSTRVSLRLQKSGNGTIQIPFSSAEEFERLFAAMTGTEASEALS